MQQRHVTPFKVHPHDRRGQWESNDGRYRLLAHELLVELEQQCVNVQMHWPKDMGPSLVNARLEYPELWRITRLRDRTSDSVRIYSAMAIEGFLNFYGVLRLGEEVFNEYFERLGVVPKVRQLLLVCDELSVATKHPLCQLADSVAQSRNRLVHPKTQEVQGEPIKHIRGSTKVPEVARQSVRDMEQFFVVFGQLVPQMAGLLDERRAA